MLGIQHASKDVHKEPGYPFAQQPVQESPLIWCSINITDWKILCNSVKKKKKDVELQTGPVIQTFQEWLCWEGLFQGCSLMQLLALSACLLETCTPEPRFLCSCVGGKEEGWKEKVQVGFEFSESQVS